MYLNRAALREITRVARHRLSLRRAWIWLGYAVGFVVIRSVLDLTR